MERLYDLTDLFPHADWVFAVGSLFLSVLVATIIRGMLKRIWKNGKWPLLRQIAPSITNFIYLLGLMLFSEFAPLPKRVDVWLQNIIYILAVLIILSVLRQAALTAIGWSAQRAQTSRTLQLGFIPLMRNLTTLFIFFMGVIMIMKHFNYDVLSLLTALGVGSLAVGLAAKDTLSNMISGFTLIIDRNLQPGDRINLNGTTGDVEEIGLRSTRIRMGDGNTLIVPNSELVNTKILNLSDPTREITCSTTLRVPYEIPFSKVREICLASIDQVEQALKNRGKWVFLSSIAEGYQTITVGFWVADLDHSAPAISNFNAIVIEQLRQQQVPLMQAAPQVLLGQQLQK